jgi:hypothetical protein
MTHQSDNEKLTDILFAREREAEDSRRQDARDRRQKEHNDKLMVRITAISVVVGLVAVGISYWAARDTSDKSRKGLELQTHAMEVDEQAAHDTSENSRKGLALQTLAMQVDEQPFVSFNAIYEQVVGTELSLDADETFFNNPNITVTGKTPAVNIRTFCARDLEGKERNWKEFMKEKPKPDKYDFILPSHTFPISCSHDIKEDSQEAFEEMDNIVKPYEVHRYCGVIYYEETNGRQHQVPFCQRTIRAVHGKKYTTKVIPCDNVDIGLPSLK